MENLYGVADLGSNSFRLLIAAVHQTGDRIRVAPVHESKESVQLAAGLSEDMVLGKSAQRRALHALATIREQLAHYRLHRLRVVATNTFRVAANQHEFLSRARAVLGRKIDVISGLEEARLIYLGAANALGARDERRLVIDIGGGSTEFIVGDDAEPVELLSTQVGCVSLTRKFFADGKFDAKRWSDAVDHASQVIDPVAKRLPMLGWHRAFGTSGTFKVMLRVLRMDAEREWLDATGLQWLIARCAGAGRADRLDFVGMREDRMSIFFGGLAIAAAIYERVPLARLAYAPGAMREGVLLELAQAAGDRGRTVARDSAGSLRAMAAVKSGRTKPRRAA